uniref:Uncharacterized protein n=1 Tax=Rhizophora mucronata TaxID=61149 RepID=A0A2P2Q4U9_RHIMU
MPPLSFKIVSHTISKLSQSQKENFFYTRGKHLMIAFLY